MKRFLVFALAMILGTASGLAAGTLPGISMTQQLDSLGRPLNGGKLYLIQAGTTSTPQNCYQDSGLTLAWPNPITLDAAGRIPQLFCADGSIKIRLTNSAGVQQLVQDNLLVVGPSGGGGGGGSVDPTTILQTGQIVPMYGTGVLSGFVRANGRTIGSASSGATERANADVQALFEYLWGADANLSVSGGRGASASADWSANKTIALPDLRGRVLAGLDDMGNTAAGRLTSSFFALPTTLGATGGGQSQTLVTANLPPYTPAGTVAVAAGAFWYNVLSVQVNVGSNVVSSINTSGSGTAVTLGTQSAPFTGTAQGGTSNAFSVLSPMLVATYYLKL